MQPALRGGETGRERALTTHDHGHFALYRPGDGFEPLVGRGHGATRWVEQGDLPPVRGCRRQAGERRLRRGRSGHLHGPRQVSHALRSDALLSGADEGRRLDEHLGRLRQAGAFGGGRELNRATGPGRSDRQCGSRHGDEGRADQGGPRPEPPAPGCWRGELAGGRSLSTGLAHDLDLLDRRLPKGRAMNATKTSTPAWASRHHGW